ncbi:MAG: DUF4329 domain-containing protein [Pseudomonadota bacterium]
MNLKTFLMLATFNLFTAESQAQTLDEIQIAKEILTELQYRSFKANREFCGTIGVDREGYYVSSRPKRGRRDSCRPRDVWAAETILFSYHTHGSFDLEAESEVPSVSDLLADIDEGTDGWVATPGGRLWFIDSVNETATQVCGLACLPQDPEFEPGLSGYIPKAFTLQSLRAFFGE